MDFHSLSFGMGAGIGFTVFCFIFCFLIRYIVISFFEIIAEFKKTRELMKTANEP